MYRESDYKNPFDSFGRKKGTEERCLEFKLSLLEARLTGDWDADGYTRAAIMMTEHKLNRERQHQVFMDSLTKY